MISMIVSLAALLGSVTGAVIAWKYAVQAMRTRIDIERDLRV